LTEFNINSVPNRIATAFLRASTPNNPMLNNAAENIRYQDNGTMTTPSS
jgi:hypothetical protein